MIEHRTVMPPRPRGMRAEDKAVHPTSPLGDRRDHAVTCRSCMIYTWNICGTCNKHCKH